MQLNKYITVLRILFLNNGYWKLLALVIASTLYFTIRSEISHPKDIMVPVEVVNDSSGDSSAIWSINPLTVKVVVRGSYAEITEIEAMKLKCVVRASHKGTNSLDTVDVKIGPKNIQGKHRRGAQIIKIEPSSIEVKFDSSTKIGLAIAPPELKGTARGTVSLSYNVTNAVVTGSNRLLNDLTAANVRIQCEPIDVDGRAESFTVQLRLLPPVDAANVKVDPPDIAVKVKIISQNIIKTNEQLRVTIQSRPENSVNRWRVEPEFVDILVRGPAKHLEAEKSLYALPSVNANIPFVAGQTNEMPVIIYVRQGLTVESSTAVPDKVKLIALPPIKPEEPAAVGF